MRRSLFLLIITSLAVAAAFARQPEMIIPKSLAEGSKIAIVTPASAIESDAVDEAANRLRARGYIPVVYPHAKGKDYGSYAANDSIRAAELMDAFKNPDISAILCARGGYGTVRLLPLLDAEVVRANPKWLIGYSDISALHAFMTHAGVASIHGPMAAHLAEEPDTLAATRRLFEVLADGPEINVVIESDSLNKFGAASGRLVGGNLLTVNGLSETSYDVLNSPELPDPIIFIEDVGEQIYAIERVLMRLHYSGVLNRAKGLIIGQFNKYKPSDDFDSMEEMIHYWLKKWGYYNPHNPMPIVFNFPAGHVSDNFPMICGAQAVVVSSPLGTTLRYSGQ